MTYRSQHNISIFRNISVYATIKQSISISIKFNPPLHFIASVLCILFQGLCLSTRSSRHALRSTSPKKKEEQQQQLRQLLPLSVTPVELLIQAPTGQRMDITITAQVRASETIRITVPALETRTGEVRISGRMAVATALVSLTGAPMPAAQLFPNPSSPNGYLLNAFAVFKTSRLKGRYRNK